MLNANLICFSMETTHPQRCIPCEVKASTAVMASHIGKIAKESWFNRIFFNLEVGVGKTVEGALLNKLGCVDAAMFEKEIVHKTEI
jgi:hypothetical protein